MEKRHPLLIICGGLAILMMSFSSFAAAKGEEGNWKRGRIYYRMVCTTCHVADGGESISPSAQTIAEWKEYFVADKHAASGKANPSVRYYVTREYRDSVKDSNKAAKKFLPVPEEELYGDVRAFVVH